MLKEKDNISKASRDGVLNVDNEDATSLRGLAFKAISLGEISRKNKERKIEYA